MTSETRLVLIPIKTDNQMSVKLILWPNKLVGTPNYHTLSIGKGSANFKIGQSSFHDGTLMQN